MWNFEKSLAIFVLIKRIIATAWRDDNNKKKPSRTFGCEKKMITSQRTCACTHLLRKPRDIIRGRLNTIVRFQKEFRRGHDSRYFADLEKRTEFVSGGFFDSKSTRFEIHGKIAETKYTRGVVRNTHAATVIRKYTVRCIMGTWQRGHVTLRTGFRRHTREKKQ